MNRKNIIEEKGITLIALVITIIVMLILVGVSINVAISGGLFKKAKEAREGTLIAREAEERLAAGEITVGGKTYATLDDFIAGRPTEISDWNAVLGNITSPHPNQEDSEDIGVGTDGSLINLDLWNYDEVSGGWNLCGDGERSSYLNENITSAGKIQGTVPQYIKKTGESTFKPVVGMTQTFAECTSLEVAPVIPGTVTSMEETFLMCERLDTAPTIPNSVTSMKNTFMNCSALRTAPAIPNSVTYMEGTFSACTRLEVAPTLPNGVTNLKSTFSGCTSLTTASTIPATAQDLRNTFKNCANLTGSLIINANPDNVLSVDNCLSGAVTEEGTTLVLSGAAGETLLTEIKETAGENNNITVGIQTSKPASKR